MRSLGTGTDPRTPQSLTRMSGQLGPCALEPPEHDEGPLVMVRLHERQRAHLDVLQLAVQADTKATLCGMGFLQGLGKRQVIRGERPALLVEGADLPGPLLLGQPTDLLEPAPELGSGRVVEEQQ